jgi:hypothetical protein
MLDTYREKRMANLGQQLLIIDSEVFESAPWFFSFFDFCIFEGAIFLLTLLFFVCYFRE